MYRMPLAWVYRMALSRVFWTVSGLMVWRTPDCLISKAFQLLRRCKTLLVRLGKTLWSASWRNRRLLWFARCIRSWWSRCRFRDVQQRRQRQYSYSNKHCDSSDNRRGCTSCLEAVTERATIIGIGFGSSQYHEGSEQPHAQQRLYKYPSSHCIDSFR